MLAASSSSPSGDGWGPEIKFDGYRIQLRAQNERVTLRTRKGLDWTGKFGAIARVAMQRASRLALPRLKRATLRAERPCENRWNLRNRGPILQLIIALATAMSPKSLIFKHAGDEPPMPLI